MAQATKRPASDGERLVAAYLDQRRLSWEYEHEVGGRNLDFLVQTTDGPVAIEVYEPHLDLPSRVGWFDPIKPVSGLFSDRKRKQIKAAKEAVLPLILVVGSANSDIPYDVYSLAGVMFGNPGVRIQIHPEGVASEPTPAFLGPGKVQQETNRGVSALAMVRRFNPTLWKLHAAWRSMGLIGRTPAVSPRDRSEVLDRMMNVTSALTESGVYLPNARLARLVILRNPYALNPLRPSFGGPHDDHYGLLSDSDTGSAWGLVAVGRLRDEVPDDD
jgi:hypothetical protein